MPERRASEEAKPKNMNSKKPKNQVAPGVEDWLIYRGTGEPHDGITRLLDQEPPPWRKFRGKAPAATPVSKKRTPTQKARSANEGRWSLLRGATFQARDEDDTSVNEIVRLVNAALYLRRPLLITGKPGTGKSSLAESVAYELKLGRVLAWPITSRSRIADGLYRYDAIGRLQEVQLKRGTVPDIANYLSLGPLGTALLPSRQPRVLLIDEIDKSDIDLPNDLLHIFENGDFEIPELTRLPKSRVNVRMFESDETFPIERGKVSCDAFPFVVLTSNGEREFPAPFLRRCLRLDMLPPGHDKLARIVKAHLGEQFTAAAEPLVTEFLNRRAKGDLATDQLLNVIYLLVRDHGPQGETKDKLIDALLKHLGSADA